MQEQRRMRLIFAVMFSMLFSFCGKDIENVVIAYIYVGDNLIDPDIIKVEKLTHINYAFADIRDGKIARGFENDVRNFEILNNLKQRNPDLKILISIGRWTWSGNFSDMAMTKESRRTFIETAVDFARKYDLDGIDIDWEYPGLEGYGNVHRAQDKQNFTYFLKELRAELDKYEEEDAKHYLTSIAAGAFDDFIKHTEMSKVQKYLDFVNLMTYDFCSSGVDSLNSHHTALYTNPLSPKKLSADHAVKIFIEAGVPAEKIVLGSAFFGKAWGIITNKNNGLFQAGGPVRIRTSYNSIRKMWEDKNGFKRYWDEKAQAPFLWNDSSGIFITYDDDVSVKKKCEYILANDLKGIMFWEYHSDYQNELVNTMHNVLLKE